MNSYQEEISKYQSIGYVFVKTSERWEVFTVDQWGSDDLVAFGINLSDALTSLVMSRNV